LGRKTACHTYGGEGLQNAITAGCDTIEHGFGLNQEEVNTMVAKGLYYDPTRMRYSIFRCRRLHGENGSESGLALRDTLACLLSRGPWVRLD